MKWQLSGMYGRMLLVLLCCLGTVLPGQTPAKPVVLKVGDRAPDFVLTNQLGNPVSLDAALKKGPVALVFYRSADW